MLDSGDTTNIKCRMYWWRNNKPTYVCQCMLVLVVFWTSRNLAACKTVKCNSLLFLYPILREEAEGSPSSYLGWSYSLLSSGSSCPGCGALWWAFSGIASPPHWQYPSPYRGLSWAQGKRFPIKEQSVKREHTQHSWRARKYRYYLGLNPIWPTIYTRLTFLAFSLYS